MCGIAGVAVFSGEPVDRTTLVKMCGAMRHRGPDEFGAFRSRQVGLAHARLSIIDLKTGQQPMSNETGSRWLVFNGEIFNYVELRDELKALGHVFRTQSDTEVILHAHAQWGDACWDKLNGQWAIALYDQKEQTLTFSRDRLGVRPLYLCRHGDKLWFGSEVKAFFAADASIPRALDAVGLSETFNFWTVVPPQTVFEGVTELEPAHTLVVSLRDGSSRKFAYWRAQFPVDGEGGFEGSLADATEAVRAALLDATRLRMLRADVPVGSYLSGGLDSSLIASLGKEAKGSGFNTFSLRFKDAEYDETQYQRLMSEKLGTEHHEVVVDYPDIANVFPEVIRLTERPILRTAPAPLHALSKLVRQHDIKVVLTGEGADEMFAGYDLFREGKVRRFWAKHPASEMRPRLLERLYPYLARSPVAQRAISRQFWARGLDKWREPGFTHLPRWQSAQALQRLFHPEVKAKAQGTDVVARLLSTLPPEFPRWTYLAQDQYLEIRTLLSGYLLSSQGDRMLMGNSVEGRFPFLDRNVVDLAFALPDSYKLHVLDEKHVLKQVARGRVDEKVLNRPKQPYRAPDAVAFTTTQPEWLDSLLSVTELKKSNLFDPKAASALWAKCRSRTTGEPFSNADNMGVVGVISTELLHQQLVAQQPQTHDVPLTTWKDQPA